MVRYLPIILGMLLIVGLTIPQIQLTDRLSGTNVDAVQCAKLLEKVPANLGDWHGEDKFVDKKIRETAGAIGAVSRIYRNSRTGEVVDLWLIVGHARDISAHTPDICYKGSGFDARAPENALYPVPFGDHDEKMPFLTNTFIKNDDLTGQQLKRVFWSWYNPENKDNKGQVIWEASTNARWHFGNTRALYKMYFVSDMRDPQETADKSACIRFARDFLPEVSKALTEVQTGSPNGDANGKTPAQEKVGSETATPEKDSSAGSTAIKNLIGNDKPTTPEKSGP
jgi:hypothetical protein